MSQAVYENATKQVLDLLERGTVPWRQPWTARDHAPRNVEGRRYRGINVWLLVAQAIKQGYSDPRWLTYRQAAQRGGYVRRGEKATPVYFWKILDVAQTDAETGERKVKHVPLLRGYWVFNVAQCEGLALEPWRPASNGDPLAKAETIISNMPNRPRIYHGDTRAYYLPLVDEIHLPDRGDFQSLDGYYGTAFHELTHSTGHKSRLDRDGISKNDGPFGSHAYGREELVAEMGAAYLCAEAGIAPATIENAASYLASWIRTSRKTPAPWWWRPRRPSTRPTTS